MVGIFRVPWGTFSALVKPSEYFEDFALCMASCQLMELNGSFVDPQCVSRRRTLQHSSNLDGFLTKVSDILQTFMSLINP